MRIDKLLSHTGFGSRKDVRYLLKSRLVKVNETIITSAKHHVDLKSDQVFVDGTRIEYEEKVYLMLNKPAGFECTHTPELYPSALELLETYREDYIMVGRLDVDTEGLLLITNDGTFSHNISHGKKEIYKTYYVELKESFDEKYIDILKQGVFLDDKPLKPAYTKVLDDKTIHLSIAEGKYHQVKRMMHLCNNEVVYLRRIQIGELKLDDTLFPGESRPLTDKEIEMFI